MKILIVTQAVDQDSPTLGFFIEWLREFSKQCERVDVIGLAVGRNTLPANVRVASMGKERGYSRPRRLFEFWRWLWTFLPDCDGVFIHMCPEYLIAGSPILAMRRKPVFLWYAHRQSSLRLRLGAIIADVVGTIGPGSFPFTSPKLRAMGHGIPTERFRPSSEARSPGRLVAVGRISKIKRLELLVEAVALLRRKGMTVSLDLWGEPIVDEDRSYKAKLERLIEERVLSQHVIFRGSAAYDRVPEIDCAAALALNACPNGALDKAVLEAMACGTPVVVTNESFIPEVSPDAGRLVASADPISLAERIESLMKQPPAGLSERLRTAVVERHSLHTLIGAILATYRGGI